MDAMGLPDEPVPMEPLIEVSGDRRVVIENHKGVTQYGRECIRVRLKFGSVCIQGRELFLARMTKGQLVVSGRIDSLELHRGCGG